MKIFCCGCGTTVKARLTSGAEIYPHRSDLHRLPFWKCDMCGNYVGCHHKTKNRTNPLGNIPTTELRQARKHIHAILDPLWKNKVASRSKLYQSISEHIGYQYHTAEIRTIEDARKVWLFVNSIRRKGTARERL